jgi:alpha-tubulin suppressor-like RCC1 family protein
MLTSGLLCAIRKKTSVYGTRRHTFGEIGSYTLEDLRTQPSVTGDEMNRASRKILKA